MKSQSTKALATLTSIFFSANLLSGCIFSSDEKAAINNSLAVEEAAQSGGSSGGGGSAAPSTPVDGGVNCYSNRFQQPAAEVNRTIDLLFLVDTSGSLNEERGQIADGIDSFVQELPSQADFNIGVILAHSSRSAWAGKLYQKASEPAVLKSSELSSADLRTHLKSKLYNPQTDYFGDGGEEMLYSLSRAFDADRLPASQANGFFRSNAALVVVIVSDENDLCAIYPSGVTRIYDPDGIEMNAFNRDCAKPGAEITVEGVLAKVKAHQGDRPLLMSAITYINSATIPVSGENEFGYGQVDLVRAANGLLVDLADGHYQEGLSEIGQLATVKLNLSSDFQLSHTNIANETMEVYVDGVLTQDYTYNGSSQTVHVNHPGSALSVIDVNYCENAENACGANGCGVIGI